MASVVCCYVLQSSVATVSGLLSSILNFYIGLLVSLVMMAETALNSLVPGRPEAAFLHVCVGCDTEAVVHRLSA